MLLWENALCGSFTFLHFIPGIFAISIFDHLCCLENRILGAIVGWLPSQFSSTSLKENVHVGSGCRFYVLVHKSQIRGLLAELTGMQQM